MAAADPAPTTAPAPPVAAPTAAPVPPFERFYTAHAPEVHRLLARRLGRQAAEDAFQETFLRALRAYPGLRHGDHLRAWALTIASRVAIDLLRRPGTDPLPGDAELVALDDEPAYRQLAHLTDGLPPTERAAVVLRYGYDLPYEAIAAALGSSPDAARQAASAGVRRLRRTAAPAAAAAPAASAAPKEPA